VSYSPGVHSTGRGRIQIPTIQRKGGIDVCANCGCGIPEDKHGDDRNITWSEITRSAEANEMSPAQAIQNMQEMAKQQSS
jgi:hypothetical protein